MPSTDDQQQALSRSKSNLATAFKIAGLESVRVRAMETLYTFCRVADDIVDEPGRADDAKRIALDQWRASIRGFFDVPGGTPPHDTLATELAGIVRAYRIPIAPLLEILDGCEMDIGGCEYRTAAELHKYCHGVACAVWLASIRVFGCVSPQSEEFAEALGYALQFTNILRDIVEDYHDLGRVYLPREEMEAFGVKPEDLAHPADKPACVRLFRLQYFRAKHYFNKARRLIAPEDFTALKAARLMGTFYEGILEKIKARGFRLSRERISLTKWEKLLALRLMLSQRGPVLAPVPRRVVVVWAGVAGIAAAIETALCGDSVTLLEARPALGGRAGCIPGVAGGPDIDCGHHAMFGCYRAFLHLADTLGVREKLSEALRLDVPYRSPGGRASRLRAAFLPAPLHLAGALAGFSELSLSDRLSISRFALALRLGSARPRSGDTAAAWLVRNGQPAGAIRALWEPFCVAALNEPIDTGCATLLEATLRRTLFGGANDSAIITATDALGRLLDPELSLYLRAVGGEVRLKTRARGLAFSGDGATPGGNAATGVATGVVLADGSTITAQVVISAVPWTEIPRLLPSGDPLAVQTAQLSGNPILNIHLFTPTPFMTEAFTALLDSPVQWVFHENDRPSSIQDGVPGSRENAAVPSVTTPSLHHYALTLSCPGAWMDLPNAEILIRVKAELLRFFPAAQDMDIVNSRVCKYPDSTFSAKPGAEAFRPGAKTHWRNVFLAGDWTATALPATLESAAQSGQTAAQLVARFFL